MDRRYIVCFIIILTISTVQTRYNHHSVGFRYLPYEELEKNVSKLQTAEKDVKETQKRALSEVRGKFEAIVDLEDFSFYRMFDRVAKVKVEKKKKYDDDDVRFYSY